jgi:hypothetical protein
MLYKFKSKSTGDLIMLEPNGRRVLEIIGKPAQLQGIVLPEQMDAALAALQAAVDFAEAERQAAVKEARLRGEDPPAQEPVSLRTRIHPFMEMLRACKASNNNITWGA